jgi:hypothetical protein
MLPQEWQVYNLLIKHLEGVVLLGADHKWKDNQCRC